MGAWHGEIKDNRYVIKGSRSAADDAFDDFVDAMIAAPELDIKLPESEEELIKINKEW